MAESKGPITANFDNNRRRRLTPAEMEEKRAQEICFFCDEKFIPGHKWKAKRQIYSLENEETDTVITEEVELEEVITDQGQEEEAIESCKISLEALHGSRGYKTLKVQGFTKHKPINILIDSSSTHNFINGKVAQRIGCKVYHMNPQDVSVAYGRVIQSWLGKLGDIQINFEKLYMSFVYQGKQVALQGIQTSFKTVDSKAFNNITANDAHIFMIKLCPTSPTEEKQDNNLEERPTEVEALLEEYYELFQKPRQLPPSRGVFDHHIPLKDGRLLKDLQEHVQHLRTTFELLIQHQLFAKGNKCVFAATRVEYLGHYISAEGVATDPKKIEVVQLWPEPTNLKQLRGFLGLAGYYRRFIKGYGVLSKPLTDLIRNDNFKWSPRATEAFINLKKALTSAPVLTLRDLSIPFIVETDTCSMGIGVVLMQKGQPIAYLSKGLSLQHQTLSVYDKELLALVMAVNKWSQYLTGRPFTMKTDQKALKFLLEQKSHTGSQLK
ncbi:uncharacterized protein [Nicotiana tomentosiformis]|uniref:uncharacterized protein n=1 Tax=Nicotiana tomentosiformis TaxID=4098 RepID=UPI00388CCD0E